MLKVRKRKYKSGKVAWYADFTVRGKRYRPVLEAANKAQAIKEAQKLFEDVLNKKYNLVDKFHEISLKELSEKYIEYAKEKKRSWDRDVISLKNILNMEINNRKLGDYSLEEITSEHILKYQTRRKRELDQKFEKKGIEVRDRNYATINRELACLKHIFYIAMDWEMVIANPVARKSIKFFKEKRRDRFLSETEIENLLNSAENHTYQIICFGLNTGMRLGEILKLKWEDIDLINRVLTVRHTKTDEDRKIPINDFLNDLLYKMGRGSIYLFPNRFDKPITTIKKSFKNALIRANISNFRFHDLRHTFSSYLAMNGVDENTRAELLGHGKQSITSSYTHSSWETKVHAVAIIGEICHVFVTRVENRQNLA